MLMQSDVSVERLRGAQFRRATEAGTGRNAPPRESVTITNEAALLELTRFRRAVSRSLVGFQVEPRCGLPAILGLIDDLETFLGPLRGFAGFRVRCVETGCYSSSYG